MSKHNANNERIKRQYFGFLKGPKRQSDATVDAVASALARFESYTKYRDFKQFHIEQAAAFKRHLAEQRNQKSGETLSKSTLHATLLHLKRFFQWLAMQPGYKSRLNYCDAEYFNPSAADTRIATASREQRVPTVEQIKHVIQTMPVGTEIERRDRALIAFTLLTGMRDSAIASIKLKHVDLSRNSVYQDAREVRTKFHKSFPTYFAQVGDDILQILVEWMEYLQKGKLWGNDDPLFPATLMTQNADHEFAVAGLKREHWSSAAAIRKIFRAAFEHAGLPYFNPHSFRHALVQYGLKNCQTAEQLKAWSQNFGHEGILTTLMSYGAVDSRRQGEIIRGLGGPLKDNHMDYSELAKAVAREMRKSRD